MFMLDAAVQGMFESYHTMIAHSEVRLNVAVRSNQRRLDALSALAK